MITLYKSTTTGETLAIQAHADGTHTASDWLDHEEVTYLKSHPEALASMDCDNDWSDDDFEGMIAL